MVHSMVNVCGWQVWIYTIKYCQQNMHELPNRKIPNIWIVHWYILQLLLGGFCIYFNINQLRRVCCGSVSSTKCCCRCKLHSMVKVCGWQVCIYTIKYCQQNMHLLPIRKIPKSKQSYYYVLSNSFGILCCWKISINSSILNSQQSVFRLSPKSLPSIREYSVILHSTFNMCGWQVSNNLTFFNC